MDFAKCYEVLKERSAAAQSGEAEASRQESIHHAHKVSVENAKLSSSNSKLALKLVADELDCLTNLDLLNLVTSLQGERFQSYREFNAALAALLEGPTSEDGSDSDNGDCLIAYPLLCAEMTARFSVLSRQFIDIKECFASNKRNLPHVANMVAALQVLEKEKLALNAASHLETIQAAFPHFQGQAGFQSQPEYTATRLQELNGKVWHTSFGFLAPNQHRTNTLWAPYEHQYPSDPTHMPRHTSMVHSQPTTATVQLAAQLDALQCEKCELGAEPTAPASVLIFDLDGCLYDAGSGYVEYIRGNVFEFMYAKGFVPRTESAEAAWMVPPQYHKYHPHCL